MSDRLLLEARDDSIAVERMAAAELTANRDGYLRPNWAAARMVDDYAVFADQGISDRSAYENLRRVFCETRGHAHEVFSQVLSTTLGHSTIKPAATMFNVAGEEWDARIARGVEALERDGVWVLPNRAPGPLVAGLREKILIGMKRTHGAETMRAAYRSDPGAEPQLKSKSEWLSAVDELYALAADPLLRAVAQGYLGVAPIFNTPVAFLNSASKLSERKQLAPLAQLYHHDMERLRFLKLFIYLTDVDEEAGPHAVLTGTHRHRPDALWRDGRIDDAEIEASGLKDREVKVLGKPGTVFLVDTSALHKGCHPIAKSRLMAQVQYVNSLFGKPYSSLDRKITAVGAGSLDADTRRAAGLVRRYADEAGVRFMQNFI